MGTMRRLLEDEGGATAIEYGLIIALVAVVVLTAMRAQWPERSRVVSHFTPKKGAGEIGASRFKQGVRAGEKGVTRWKGGG